MRKSWFRYGVGLYAAACATAAIAGATASATLGPLVVTIEDLTPNDGVASFVVFSPDHNLFGYVEHLVNGEPYFMSPPFSTAPNMASTSVPGVYLATVTVDAAEGTWTAFGSIQSGNGGEASGAVLSATEVLIGPNTRLTLASSVDASVFADDPLAIAVADGNVQIDVGQDSFLDQITAVVFGAGSDHEVGLVSVSYSTGAESAEGIVYRTVGADPFLNAPPIPEPEVFALMALGLLLLPAAARRARR